MGMFNDLQKLDQKDKQAAAMAKRKRPSFDTGRGDELGPSPRPTDSAQQEPRRHDVMQSRSHEITMPSMHERAQSQSHHVTPPRYDDSLIEEIRKHVKLLGREPSTIRLTVDEKRRLEEIGYTLKRQGIDTSHNELFRIALHHLLADYGRDGKESVLARVLAVLHS